MLAPTLELNSLHSLLDFYFYATNFIGLHFGIISNVIDTEQKKGKKKKGTNASKYVKRLRNEIKMWRETRNILDVCFYICIERVKEQQHKQNIKEMNDVLSGSCSQLQYGSHLMYKQLNLKTCQPISEVYPANYHFK